MHNFAPFIKAFLFSSTAQTTNGCESFQIKILITLINFFKIFKNFQAEVHVSVHMYTANKFLKKVRPEIV